LARDDVKKELDVEKEHDKVEGERHNVEHKTLLCPLLSVIQFEQGKGVLKVILYGLE
jgi:hypothetical protein